MAKKKVPVYTEWPQVEEALKAIAAIDSRIAIEEAQMNQDIDRIKARVKDIITPLTEEKAALENNIEDFTKSRIGEFTDSKSKKFTYGTVGFRKTTEITVRNIKAVLQALKKLKMTDCITFKESLNKEELAKYDDASLEKIGAKRKTADKYYYEVNKERIDA